MAKAIIITIIMSLPLRYFNEVEVKIKYIETGKIEKIRVPVEKVKDFKLNIVKHGYEILK